MDTETCRGWRRWSDRDGDWGFARRDFFVRNRPEAIATAERGGQRYRHRAVDRCAGRLSARYSDLPMRLAMMVVFRVWSGNGHAVREFYLAAEFNYS